MDVLRLVTIHPTLVHLTLGLVPAMAAAYLVAAARRSERWTFVGDVLLAFAAGVTVATAAFGLVSNAALAWPGGLATWRWLHLGLGAATGVWLLAMAALRFRGRRARPVAGFGLAGAGVAVFLLATATGWVGGEVLVYHAGLGVEAAAQGALSPPLTDETEAPADMEEAMHRLREAWAGAKATVAAMVVEHPTSRAFDRLKGHARRLEALGGWLVDQGARGGHAHGDEGGDGHASGDEGGSRLAGAGRALQGHARALGEAAEQEDVVGAADAVGRTTATCAGCHVETRWR